MLKVAALHAMHPKRAKIAIYGSLHRLLQTVCHLGGVDLGELLRDSPAAGLMQSSPGSLSQLLELESVVCQSLFRSEERYESSS
jgi:hypothetical protein